MNVRTRPFVIGGLGFISLGLVMLGMTILLSAAGAMVLFSRGTDANIYSYLGRQLMWFAVGLVGMTCAYQIDHSRLQNKARPLLILTIILLVLCLVGPFAKTIKGASRWIEIGPLRGQPSDLAKLAIILYLADVWSRKSESFDDFFRGLLPSLLILGLVLGLIFKQPDKGTAIFIASVAGCMWFVAGGKTKHLCIAGGLFICVACVLILTSDYAWARVDKWWNGDGGYQVRMALIGMKRGGLTGVGLGEGVQKLGFTPEVQTDFIFSVLAEELGYIASTVLVVAFGLLAALAVTVAWQANDRFGALLAIGCGAAIDLQAILNLLVVTGTIPSTGISLPFISYGGSGLVINMVMVGLIASVAQACLLPDGNGKRPRRGRARVGNRTANRPVQ